MQVLVVQSLVNSYVIYQCDVLEEDWARCIALGNLLHLSDLICKMGMLVL